MLVIDGENCVLGRLASKVAKRALGGETVRIYNVGKIVILGKPEMVMKKYKQRRQLHDIANPLKGPKLPRRPDFFVKRAIRGMLPRKTKRGDAALRRIHVFMDLPPGGAKKVAEAKGGARRITITEVCKGLGWSG
jgi:large subunit ribosomal protein L13